MCEECECSTCMNDKQCCWFFAGWNIATSCMCAILASVQIHKYSSWMKGGRAHGSDFLILNSCDAKLAFWSVILAASIMHLMSGSLLVIGLSKDIRWLFLFGKTTSHIFPCAMLFSILAPVVHCVCIVRVCRFYRSHWR
ncbi:uncharacterized protein LOC117891897 [Drosophila subobscura]|uniref:uncharacterized protein LOC117891897 n=1 Tax=Drosophila subobscura TaxID=7241 RepID=UPI00155AFDBB|nr:uncharacterized protein LOC117891897 [Drosophila subobscura]